MNKQLLELVEYLKGFEDRNVPITKLITEISSQFAEFEKLTVDELIYAIAYTHDREFN